MSAFWGVLIGSLAAAAVAILTWHFLAALITFFVLFSIIAYQDIRLFLSAAGGKIIIGMLLLGIAIILLLINGFFTIVAYAVLAFLMLSLLLCILFDDRAGKWMVILLMYAYVLAIMPIFVAWTPIVAHKAEVAGTQLGIGEKIGMLFESASHAFNNTWLMITQPDVWAQQQFIEKGKREEGATNLAIEIEKVEVYPEKAFPSLIHIDPVTGEKKSTDEEASIIFTLDNKGDKPSEVIRFGAVLDNTAYKRGARIGDVIEGEKENLGKTYVKSIPALYPNQKIIEDLTLFTPYCDGAYTFKTFVEYEYNVTGLNNIEFIDFDYYMELLKRKKLVPEDRLSVSSAGPFKVTLRTSKLQPIPVYNGKANFKMYIGVVNEREGNSFLKSIYLHLPPNIKPADETECKWKYIGKDKEGKYDIYAVIEPLDPKNDTEREKAQEESTKRCIYSHDARYFSCDMVFTGEVLQSVDEVVKVEIEYIFRYEKSLSFAVVKTPESKKCSELKESDIPQDRQEDTLGDILNHTCIFSKPIAESNNYYLCSIEADETKIADLISRIATYCISMKYGGEDEYCGTIKLDPVGSKCYEPIEIAKKDIEIGSEEGSYNFADVSIDNGKLELISARMYDLRFDYRKGVCNLGGYIKLTLLNNDYFDNYECNLDIGMPCEDNSQCSSGNCNSAFNYMLSIPGGPTYDSILAGTNSFVSNIITAHELTLPSDISAKIKWKYPEYYLWVNPSATYTSASGELAILPEEIREFIKNMKPLFGYLEGKYTGDNYGKVIPSKKVCQPSYCDYSVNPPGPVVTGTQQQGGCMCNTPFYLYTGYRAGPYCLDLCTPNALVTKTCFCASPKLYQTGENKAYKEANDAAINSVVITPVNAKDSCSGEEDLGNVRYICCIDDISYPKGRGFLLTQSCTRREKTYENGTVMTDAEGNVIYEYYWTPYEEYGDNFAAMCAEESNIYGTELE